MRNLLSQNQLEHFREQGYVHLEGVISQEHSHRLALAYAHLVRAQQCKLVPDRDFERLEFSALVSWLLESLWTLEQTDHAHIQRIYDTVRQSPALLQAVSDDSLTVPVTQLLNLSPSAALYLKQTTCRIDVPNDSAFILDWHQEVHYSFKDTELIQLWAPAIADITIDNGAMRILPGSHKEGVAPTNDTVPDFGVRQFTVVQDVVKKYKEKIITMPRGDALLFSNKLMHKSGRNTSNLPRLTLLTHYYDTSTPGFYQNLASQQKPANPYSPSEKRP